MPHHINANRLGLLIAPRDLLPGAPYSRVLSHLATQHGFAHIQCMRCGDDLLVLFSEHELDIDRQPDSIIEGRWPQPLGFKLVLAFGPQAHWQIRSDHAGIRPLYHGNDDTNRLIVSTFPEAIACLIDSRVNTRTLAEQLLVGFPLDDHTVFNGVHRLQTGEVISSHRMSSAHDDRQSACSSMTGAADWMHAIRARVVECFANDAALELSGGIDSRLVLAMGMSQGQKPGLAFTLGYPDDADVKLASRICQRYGIPHHVLAPECHPHACVDDARRFVVESGYVVNTNAYAWLPNVFRSLDSLRTMQVGGGGGECATGFYYSPFDALCRSPVLQRQWILRRLMQPGVALESMFTDDAATHHTQAVVEHLEAIMQRYKGEWWRRSDQFYRQQRCVNAGGPVLTASARWYQPIQPLLDAEHLAWCETLTRSQRAYRTLQMKLVHDLNRWLGQLPYASGARHGWTALARIRATQQRIMTMGSKVMSRMRQAKSHADLGACETAAIMQQDDFVQALQQSYVDMHADEVNPERLDALRTSAQDAWHELGMLNSHALAHHDLVELKSLLRMDQDAFLASPVTEPRVA